MERPALPSRRRLCMGLLNRCDGPTFQVSREILAGGQNAFAPTASYAFGSTAFLAIGVVFHPGLRIQRDLPVDPRREAASVNRPALTAGSCRIICCAGSPAAR